MKQTLQTLALVLLVCIAGLSGVKAQTGAWLPLSANYSYPRTLLTAADLPKVRQSLTDSAVYLLYNGVYLNGTSGVPVGNTSSNERRQRAQVAKNAAFVALLNRQPLGQLQLDSLQPALRAQVEANARQLLEELNPAVEGVISYTEWQWRSKELIDYLVAYDLLRGAGVPEAQLALSKTKLQQFASNLYTQATQPFFGYAFFQNIKNNHALMTAAALGMAAVVLNDAGGTAVAAQPQAWLNAGLYHLDNILWRDAARMSEPEQVAGYYEGPYYFKYAFLNCLPFIRAIGHFLPDTSLSCTWGNTTRSIRNPWHDPNYDNLYAWAASITMPDGRLPALEDSYIDMGMPELALTGKAQYLRPMNFRNFEPGQLASLHSQLADATVDMRAAYIAACLKPEASTHEAPLTALPAAGNLIFRSNNKGEASYLHLYGKNGKALSNSGGHNHADAGAFILHAQGQLLAFDPGYLSYNRRNETGNAHNHNMILVDGAGPAIGSSGAANDAQAFIQHTFSTSSLSYGEIKTAYNGAEITRKALAVRGQYYLLTDAVSSAQPRQYTWQLHGYGFENGDASTGTFAENFSNAQASWQKNGVTLLAQVSGSSPVGFQKGTAIHEVTYNTTQNHTVLLAQQQVAQAEFMAVLYPHAGVTPALKTIAATGAAAMQLQQAGLADVAIAQPDTLPNAIQAPALNETLTTDARFMFTSTDSAGTFRQVFLQQGKILKYGQQVVLQSSRRVDVVWQQVQDRMFEGYVSRATTLSLTAPESPASVTGSQIWHYDPVTKQLQLSFSGPGSFSVALPAGLPPEEPLPVELISFEASRNSSGIMLRWATAMERNNAGFTIERSADGVTFEGIGFVSGKGNSLARQDYSFTDAAIPASHTAYYRLQQRDTDGQASYSPVIVVPKANTGGASVQVWPVPAQDVLQIQDEYSLYQRLQLFSLEGQLQLEQEIRQQISLPVQHLRSGLYILKLQPHNPQQEALIRKVLIRH